MSIQTQEFEVTDLGPFIEAANRAAEEMGKFKLVIAEAMSGFDYGILVGDFDWEDERCDYSWLFESQCAHCMGHVADFDPPKKVVVYGP